MLQRNDTRQIHFEQRIPRDVLPVAVGRKLDIPIGTELVNFEVRSKTRSVRVSLRTSDRREAKVRYATVSAYLERVWQALRTDSPIPLTHRQAVALSKRLYVAWAEEREATLVQDFDRTSINGVLQPWAPAKQHDKSLELMPPDSWEAVMARLDELMETPEVICPVVDRLCLRVSIAKLDDGSRLMVARELLHAMRDGVALRHRQAAGDYTPDPKAERFPAYADEHLGRTVLPFEDLLDGWWREAKIAGRAEGTHEAYKYVVARFKEHLGHNDAARATPDDVVRFKEARLRSGASPATVRSLDLGGLRSLYGWAVSNRKLSVNPAEGIKVPAIYKTQTRTKGFTTAEATAILQRTSLPNEGSKFRTDHTPKARRWVPWLCAYTGARVGEILQLRKQDVYQKDGAWVMLITPEAGRVKNKKFREVVLHEHLVAQGFVTMVEASSDGHLFIPDVKQLRAAVGNMGTWVRPALKGSDVAPNHGWRHLFKTRGRDAGIEDSVLDAICGHAPVSVGRAYGDVTLKAITNAMAKFPRFEVGHKVTHENT